MADQTQQRNISEARMDARYAAQFHKLNVRFYRRLKALFTTITLASGTAAFSLVFGVNREIGAWAGGVLALVAIVEHVVDPSTRAAEHLGLCERYGELLARRDLGELADFDAAMEVVRSTSCGGITSLAPIAYNDNVRSAGYESFVRPLTALQRVFAAVV